MARFRVPADRHMDKEDIMLRFLKKTVAAFLAVLVLASMLTTVYATENDKKKVYTEVNETVYATANVFIRSGPGMSHKRIGMLSNGHAIQRTAIGSNGWSKVKYEGKTAYIYSKYLSTTKPVITTPNVDYTALSVNIALTNGMKAGSYTAESWAVLEKALSDATSALNSKSQKKVDSCNEALEKAIAGLVRMDCTTLEAALKEVDAFTGGNTQNELWVKLVEAVNNGRALLDSGDQEAINAAAEEISTLLAELKAEVQEQNTPEIITQEVQVEVPPTDDYCNIPGHRAWPVLFFCSLALNLALAALIVVYTYMKKKNRKDDTPLVDYDISDDMF